MEWYNGGRSGPSATQDQSLLPLKDMQGPPEAEALPGTQKLPGRVSRAPALSMWVLPTVRPENLCSRGSYSGASRQEFM